LYLITEYAGGGELFDYIVTNTKLNEIESVRILQQILNAVEYMHKLGIVHRDLKPENLLLDYDNNIKVVDFGLSSIYAKGEQLRTACGSPCYAAPEMVTAQPYSGLKTDIWSCGIILYAMCCGYLPFDDPDTAELYRKIAEGNYQLPDHISIHFRSLFKIILNVSPSRRATIK
jgi:5'-AMP-activated protein kinase catalytic alpha subunit